MQKITYEAFLALFVDAINQERHNRKLELLPIRTEYPEVEKLYKYITHAERDWNRERRRNTFVLSSIIPCDETHLGGEVTKDSGFLMMEISAESEEIFDISPDNICAVIGDRVIMDAADMYACGEISKEKYELVRPYNPADADKYLELFKGGKKVA